MNTAANTGIVDLIAPMTVEEFVRSFAKKSVYVKGERNKFRGLFAKDALLEAFRASPSQGTGPLVVYSSAIDLVDETGSVRIDVIGPDEAEGLHDAGQLVLVTRVDRCHAQLRESAQRIRAELGYAGEVSWNVQWVPAGRGLRRHFNFWNTITLQIEGSQTYEFAPSPSVAWPHANAGCGPDGQPRYVRDLDDGREPPMAKRVAENEFRRAKLQPGDLLVTAPGTWQSTKSDDDSLALVLTFWRYPTTSLLINLIRAHFEGSDEWLGVPLAYLENGALSNESLREFADRLLEASDLLRSTARDGTQFLRVIGETITRDVVPPGQSEEEAIAVTPDMRFEIPPIGVFAFDGPGGTLNVCANGSSFETDGLTARFIRIALETRTFIGQDCEGWDIGETLSWADIESLLAQLVELGLIVICPSRNTETAPTSKESSKNVE